MPPKKEPPKSSPDKKSSDTRKVSNAGAAQSKSPSKKGAATEPIKPQKDSEAILAEILAEARAAQRKAQEEARAREEEEAKNAVAEVIEEPPEVLAEKLIKSYLDAIDNHAPHAKLVAHFSTQGEVGFVFPQQETIIGANKIAVALSYMYSGLNVKHSVLRYEHENPPSRCNAFIKCYSQLMIDKDTPRNVLQIFELRNASPEEIAAAATPLGPYRICHHLFVCVDSRPLYHFSTVLRIPKGKNDNWDPAFAHLKAEYLKELEGDDEDMKSLNSKGSKGAKEGEAGEGEAEEGEEEDDADDEGSILSGVSGTAPNTHAQTAAEGTVGAEGGSLADEINPPNTTEAITTDGDLAGQSEIVQSTGELSGELLSNPGSIAGIESLAEGSFAEASGSQIISDGNGAIDQAIEVPAGELGSASLASSSVVENEGY